MSNYTQLLRDPRWQQKRLRIFERDGWRCVRCQNSKEELHAHHLKYRRGCKPWDYPDSLLETLCSTCHKDEHFPICKPPDFTSSDINGIIIPWISDPADGYGLYEAIPWTGQVLRKNHPDRNAIFVCANQAGHEILIDAGCGTAFRFPEKTHSKAASIESLTGPFGSYFAWIECARKSVMEGDCP